ncbi:1951_t:CDS:2, partial [Racocetra persica]
AATIRKKKLDKEFVKWFRSNYASNFEVPPDLNYINICRGCNKNLNLQKPSIEEESVEAIDLTIDITSHIQEHEEIKPLPKKKSI